MTTNIHDAGPGRYVGGETPTRDDHLATKGYVDAHSGGAPVDVTDGSTTVIAITELDFTSGATVTDAGGGVAQVVVSGGGGTVVGPFTVNFGDAGFVNPENNGIQTVTLPSGVIADVFAVQKVAFVGAGNPGDELDLVVAASAGGAFVGVAYLNTGDGVPPGAPALAEINVLASHVPKLLVVTTAPCFVYASLYASQPVTAGQIDVYAILTTP